MAKKKPSSTRRKRTPVKDLPSPAGGAEKVKGGLLLDAAAAGFEELDGRQQPAAQRPPEVGAPSSWRA